MAQFIKGDVVVVPFPFSDLSHIILYCAGNLRKEKVNEVISEVVKIVRK